MNYKLSKCYECHRVYGFDADEEPDYQHCNTCIDKPILMPPEEIEYYKQVEKQ